MFEKFQDYMYYLLPGPLKKIAKTKNQFYILFKVFGKVFDQSKQDIFRVREESMIISASGKMLSEHGRDRNMPRFQGEDVENYRIRLSMKNIIAEKAGSNEGIVYALRSLGFKNFDIQPLWKKDPERWAEFMIIIDEQDIDLCKTFNAVKSTVRDVKMASSLPNYGFQLYSSNPSSANETVVKNTMAVNFFGNISILLDGSWMLDGTNLLSGYVGYREPMPMRTYLQMSVPTSQDLKAMLTTEYNLWRLDGSFRLDGTKELSAAIWEEEL